MTVSSTTPPHHLQLVLDFVNTLDVETQSDALSFPEQLAAWLRQQGLIGSSAPRIGNGEHRQAIELREALRETMHAHTRGSSGTAGAAAQLDAVAEAGRLAPCFEPDGRVHLAARHPGYPGVLARLLVPVATAALDGTWSRVKACDADDCAEAFYDRSRNRSGRWCDMAVCGNRTKVRAYRSKRRS